MKLLVLLLLLNPVVCLSQAFEGKISYANSYKSKSPQLKDEQLAAMMGTTQDYYIKGANYKSVFNGAFIKMQLYNSSENRSYTLTGRSDSLYWEDYGKNKDAATKFEIEKGKENILGELCDVIIVYTPKTKTSYYYSSKYKVNPDLFTRHAYGNWYYIISKTQALPLKTVYEDEQFSFTSVAVNIVPMKVDSKVFDIPDKNKVTPARW